MFNIKSIFALVLFLLTATAVLANETPQISQQTLLTALHASNTSIVVLDVRTKEEYAQGHIAGAINMSHETVEDNLAALSQYKNSKVVVYCRSGRRAGLAEDVLTSNGFTNVIHLTGDMNGWLDAKLPVVSK